MVARSTRMEITLMCSEHSAHSIDSGLEESGHSNLEVSLGMGRGLRLIIGLIFQSVVKTKQYQH